VLLHAAGLIVTFHTWARSTRSRACERASATTTSTTSDACRAGTSELSRAREFLTLAVAMVEHEREPDAARWQAPVEARVDELDGAVSAFLDAGEKNAALRLVGELSYLCQDTGRVRLGRDLAVSVLAVVGRG
jgi:hypothetical protein